MTHHEPGWPARYVMVGGFPVRDPGAGMAPEALSALVAEAIAEENRAGHGASLTLAHEARLRPARPTPTHHISVDGPA